MNRAHGSDGYTLVEALVSLALVGLMSLMLVIGVQAARQRLARDGGGGGGQQVEAAQQVLRARIERSFPLTTLVTPRPFVEFDGRGDELNFLAPPPLAQAPDALHHYRLYLALDGDLDLDDVSDLATPSTPPTQTVLARNVAALDIAYFGQIAPQLPAQWSSHWQQQSAPPQLVRVRVSFPPRDRRTWPTLIVRPAASINSSCRLDPNTGSCQGRT